jgi:hypothetical protein
MSPRKRTIDDLDDLDDEDGMVAEDLDAETDMSLAVREEDEVGLGGTSGVLGAGGDDEDDADFDDDLERGLEDEDEEER